MMAACTQVPSPAAVVSLERAPLRPQQRSCRALLRPNSRCGQHVLFLGSCQDLQEGLQQRAPLAHLRSSGLRLKPLGRPSSSILCSATDSSGKPTSDSSPVRYFKNDERPEDPLEVIPFDSETGLVDLTVLTTVAGTDRPYVRVLDSTGKLWVSFTGRLGGPVKFYGDGTASKPYLFRKPESVPYAERVAFAQVSPSTMSESYLRNEQRVDSTGANIPGEENARLLYNHRPFTAAALPASLAYPGFGRFLDGLKSKNVRPGREDYEAAAALCNAGHQLFLKEDKRRDAINAILSEFLEKLIEPVNLEARLTTGRMIDYTTDGSAIETTKAGDYMSLNTEYKNEGGPVYFQNQFYYKTFWGARLESPLLQSSVVPTFLIDQPGPLFSVVAAFFTDHLHAEPLTPALNLVSLERYNLDQMEYLARVLLNLKRELKELDLFMREAANENAIERRKDYLQRNLPYPFYSHFERSGSIFKRLRDISRPRFITDGQRIWVAVLDTGEEVLVKFAQTYGKLVHKAWAEEGFAPRLYECEPIAGGFFVVVMEYLSGEDTWISMASLKDEARRNVLPLVEQTLRQAHAVEVDGLGGKGVLGDCRDQNILLQCEKEVLGSTMDLRAQDVLAVRFIDFDWAGVAGVQRYPPFMNTKQVVWPAGVETGNVIDQHHDVDLLRTGGRIVK
ncbi:hypothetical protein KFL_010880010 [Klebsormidium nitens]|uniref:Protein kinase domain-containing protein n=1 Tax=Klebsormidium nitens TaxID=105231 RepID=A0A1Y1IUY3_KLENI|nr:hypothetical protein KFL_010880010 [Klebsormidium nitens]|eukprot:GAQ92666.1 hypothetical protein KFL_010880010 [Klebsormidium nitens]